VIIILCIPYVAVNSIHGNETITIQPCLPSNASIVRNSNFTNIEQPLIVASGYKSDLTPPSDHRALLKFDLSTLPEGKYVDSAVLHLYVVNVYEWDGFEWMPLTSIHRTIGVYRVTTDWEGNLGLSSWMYATYPNGPWDSPGGDFEGPTDTVKYEEKDTWNEWDVTKDVSAWYTGEHDNYGWLLKDSNEGDEKGYSVWYSSYKLWYLRDERYSPKLVITLTDTPSYQYHYIAIVPIAAAISLIYYLVYRRRRRLIPNLNDH